MQDIDNVLHRLTHEQGMSLEIEVDVAGFLGVHNECNADTGEITLTQQGLIERTVEALGVHDLPAVDTPADCVLGHDEDEDPPSCAFSHALVVGMLWYVCGHS
jgi:hypothetical protein